MSKPHSKEYVEDEMSTKLRKVATYIHDIWYIYKDHAKRNNQQPTADGFFDWLESEIL